MRKTIKVDVVVEVRGDRLNNSTDVWIGDNLCDEITVPYGKGRAVLKLIEEHGLDWWRYAPDEWRFV
jgi:hypothetical protein